MSLLAWIVFGVIAGFLAALLVDNSGLGLIRNMVLGILGAMLGGYLFQRFGMAGVTGFNIYSLLVATAGAILVLLLFHLLFGR